MGIKNKVNLDLKKLKPYKLIKNIKIPLILIYGKQDEIIPKS